MTILFAAFLVVHGLIHLLGAAKAFRIAELSQLTQQISRPLGALWLLAAGLLLATAVARFTWPRGWWAVGAGAIVLSQVAIFTAWGDAKVGTVANVIALVGVALGFLSQAPFSYRAEYERDVEQALGRAVAAPILTEADLAHLPAAVQRYIRFTGAVGQPRAHNFLARFHGKIRSGPDARWMSFTGEQSNAYDQASNQASRLFLMDASMFGIPVQAFHRFVGPSATMRVKVASLVQVVDVKGPEMDVAETVTLFNDLCVFAPGSLIDRAIEWREIDPHTVGASFTNAGRTIQAVLSFNDRDELVDFVSDDRQATFADGKKFTRMRWSTPLRNYRTFGSRRLMSEGECLWHAPGGKYVYLQFTLDSITYNLSRPIPRQ